MKMPTMTDMGMRRGDMEGEAASPASPKDWKKEMVYPTLRASGRQAQLLGADDLKAGEMVRQTVVWKVKSVTKTERDGKKDYELTLELVRGSDLDAADDTADDADDSGEQGPGIAMLMAKSAE